MNLPVDGREGGVHASSVPGDFPSARRPRASDRPRAPRERHRGTRVPPPIEEAENQNDPSAPLKAG